MRGCVYELVGEAAKGKSQLCFQICVNATKNRHRRRVLYVDTEGSFRTKRIVQIAKDRDPQANEASILASIRLCRVMDAIELTSALGQAVALARADPEIGLVVLDSVAFPIRVEHECERRKMLTIHVAQELMKFAIDLNCVVVVANQVTMEVNRGGTLPALGSTWAHHITVRFYMAHNPKQGSKAIKIAKSPFDASWNVYYNITNRGIESFKRDCDPVVR
ncbi:hypothetical protein L596_018210 [Steinernema carpocapsae]|uniref:DNA repair protein RAD51 homolog 3 n=1 Tax=Steinernema carpocapsae TaxID=34508 RepID=A0A4U5N4F4_STECR|nr:hypothetical protein L596_018210 [Steinernema carpocapsae]